MRPINIDKVELIARLRKQFNANEPIFTEEILAAWSEYSRPRVFQLLKELCESGEIAKYILGVYYFPKIGFSGIPLPLSADKIAEKRYLRANGQVFGYYSGLTLLNMVGLSNQFPFTLEIVTTKETTAVRLVTIGKREFLLRRAKTEITDENIPVLQMLEIFSKFDRPLEKYQAENILALADGKRIDRGLVAECAKYYPKRALQNLTNSEIGYVIA